jgi:hypothetical protein
MSFSAVYDLYGFSPLTLDDVSRAFADGTVTLNATDAFDVSFQKFSFELFDATDVASPHFMRWVAEQEGSPMYTQAYRMHIEGYDTDEPWACLTALASRMNGVAVTMESGDGAGYMTDDQVEYTPPDPDTVPVKGRALAMTWFGRLRMCEHPVAQWIRTCEEHFPDFMPDRFDYFDKRLITDSSKAWLTSPDSREWSTTLWHSALLGRIQFFLPLVAKRRESAEPLEDSLYDVSCYALLDSVVERGQMDRLSEFFTGMARELHAEVASCEVLDGHKAKDDLAEFTTEAQRRQEINRSRDHTLLGLFPDPVWWLWLGHDYSRLLSPWLQTPAPPSWNINADGDANLIRTSPTPARREELRDEWLPHEYRIRKNLFGRPRPAKTLPPWATV